MSYKTIKDKLIGHDAFAGYVHSHPGILDGSIDEIVAPLFPEKQGSAWVGFADLSLHREALRLLQEGVKAVRLPAVSAGSIDSFERIELEVWQKGAWGFTIGSALFNRRFVPSGSFRDCLPMAERYS